MLRYFAFLLLSLPLHADDPVAATVNGDTIRVSEVDALLAKLKPPGPLTSGQSKTLRETVLDDLIDETLLRQYLAKHAPPADPKEIETHIQALAAVQKQQGKALSDFLRETGLTEKRLRESFDTSLRLQKLVEGRTPEVEYAKYFETHKAHFEGAKVRLSHILLRVSPGAADGETAAAKEKLRILKADIEAGRISFAAAAKAHSICASAALGGDLGVISRRDAGVEDELAAAAFALPAKAVSEPIRTASGWHLVCTTARTPGTPTTYEKCRETVKEAYLDDARTRLAAQLRIQAELRKHLP